MESININEANDFSSKVSIKPILETPATKEISIFMSKGQSMKEHKSPFPIIIHITEGSIDFGVNGERHQLKAGDILTLKGHIPHDLIATENSKIRLTLAKADALERVKKVVQ